MDQSPSQQPTTVLITGANQGIGYEFTRQYAARGWEVIAGHRRASEPETLVELQSKYNCIQIEFIDVTNMDSIKDAAEKLRNVPIDILINNAGFGGNFIGPNQMFGSLDYDEFFAVLDSMTLGAMRMTEAFLNNIRAGNKKIISVITSETGSLTAARSGHTPLGRAYWLGTSKAAINFLFVKMSWQFKDDGVKFLMLDPGLVRDTNEEAWMQARGETIPEFRRMPGMPERVNIDVSVSGMIGIMDAVNIQDSGKIFDYQGKQLPD